MDAPVEPRVQDFDLTEASLSRLERHWYPPIDSRAGLSPGSTIWVRGLRPKHLVILGVALAALRIFLWARGDHESLLASITLMLLGTIFFAGVLGALAGALVADFVVRPLYMLSAKALVPGFDAFCRFKHVQGAYKASLEKYQLWQAPTLTEFWCPLPGVAFEREVARLYQASGYQVRLTPGTADGGIDIVLERGCVVTAVQCKAHRKKVGVAVGRELVTSAKDIGADRMIIACTHGVSEPLKLYAREKSIEIVTAGELARLQMGLKEMSQATLLVERPASIAERLKRRATARRGASGSSPR
jgi:HJR/Mrr/RecB family endonuclease